MSADEWFSWAALVALAVGALLSAAPHVRRLVEQREGVEEAEAPAHRRRPVEERRRRQMVTRPHALPVWED